ncbi:CBS domain-containing protein [Streptomyces sp. NBC_01643]|uniref:CBS domain-containing protein n=1 Tax=Streptomyces sp. NBC_01643 TaxID=2975906 RepID=UPI00386EE08D|nr:CBS domain-containing protein [Streptomyces sp. NBC_01643]
MRAWTVRGGQFGEREQRALAEGLTIAGWEETGDLSRYGSAGEIGDLLTAAYPDESQGTIDNWKHQLWRFISMDTGDFVVMPRKHLPVVAVGRLIGGYEYRAEAAPGFRHVRPVDWVRPAVERAAIGGDLRDSMGAFSTVSELSRRDAAERVRSLAETGTDPGYEGGIEPPAGIEALARDVREDGTRQLTARDLIGLWGWSRRTTDVIDQVDQELATLGLRVEPHFTEGQLDGLVTVSSQEPVAGEESSDGTAAHGPTTPRDSLSTDGAKARDLSWRIGNLPFVQEVVTVSWEAPLSSAITPMIEHDFSQLPVVDRHNVLRGVVTWEDIARAHLGKRDGTIADVLNPHPQTAREQEELFARIGDIQRHGFLIIVDTEYAVRGILTATDLAGQLRQRVEPFTLLEEVERRLRRMTHRFTTDELPQEIRSKRANGRQFTLGQYKFLLADAHCWAKLDWPYGQQDMLDRLKTVADYRNALAHWAVDAPAEDATSLAATRQLLKLLKVIDHDPRP